MRAAYIEQTGPVEAIQVGDLPRPEPGPAQVLVKVGATALNPIDIYLRSGFVAMPMSFPYIIGCDLAGTVEAVGPGASRFQVGDRVWGSNQGQFGRQGVTAEWAAVDEDWLYPTPASLADAEVAAMALAGITAHLGLFQNGRLQPEEKVYVPGGSGGVGSMVVQMAKAAGAHVATSAGGAEKIQICQGLGADMAFNYKSDDIPARLREFAPDGIDVWFETQREPDLDVAIPLLHKRGRMLLIAGRTARPVLPLGAFYPRDCSLLGFAMFNASPVEQRRCADDIVQWAESSLLKPLIGRTYPLAEAAQAERELEGNTLNHAGTLHGKVVIKVE
jgi:NADPH2:quinone reductase